MNFLKKIFGDENKKKLKELRREVEKVNALEPEFEKLTDQQLKAKTQEFRDRLEKGETLDQIFAEAFATVRETAKRVLGQRHYDVQIMGGIVLHRSGISEMRTGEGKTLTSTCPVYLNAIAGKGVHVVTVNDYLAKRDAVWMGQIYEFLGMSIGIIQNQQLTFIYDKTFQASEDGTQGSETDQERDTTGSFEIQEDYVRPAERREAYACDITYGTNNEFGFDYLRDNMVHRKDQMVQRDYNHAIIDEIDSILIDEARTPLIISAPAQEAADEYVKFAKLVGQLEKGKDKDYEVEEKLRAATLTDQGIAKVEKILGMGNIYVEGGIKTVHHVEQALKANVIFTKDKDYVVQDNEVVIVDQFTGRLMPGRRYSDGLHQAIEAKEGVEIQKESQTLGTVTFQNLFRLYPKLSGMTGTAATESEEFFKIYGLEVVTIPTNRPDQRKDHDDLIFKTEEAKLNAVIQDVKERQAKGQPVLIGTISIEKNEELTLMLEREGIKHEILNAKNHQREAEIIAQAGRTGSVTLATNMAGRGVDIVLGGNPKSEEQQEKVKQLGGLYVIGTERHESRRIDNQLRGRSGRQGDPGETQIYVSTEDDLMRIFGGDRLKSMMQKLRMPDEAPIQHKFISKSLENAQKKVESNNFDTRKHLLDYDDVLNRHREAVYTKRREILDKSDVQEQLSGIVEDYIKEEVETLVNWNLQGVDEKNWKKDDVLKELGKMISVDSKLTGDFSGIFANAKIPPTKKQSQAQTLLTEYATNQYKEVSTKIDNPDLLKDVEKNILLRSIDSLWVEHLEAMGYLRTGIGLRGYGQRDPLVEYRREGHMLYEQMQGLVRKDSVYGLFNAQGAVQAYSGLLARQGIQTKGAAKTSSAIRAGAGAVGGKRADTSLAATTLSPVQTKARNDQGDKIGRNDPCSCGSGKKYKKCCAE